MKREERVEYWERHVNGYLSSGLTRVEYCRRHGIRTHNLDYWRRKLSSADAGSIASGTEWIPLQVCDDDAVPGKAGGISLRVGCVVIEVEAGFDPLLLTEVLRVVGSTCLPDRQAC